MVVPVGVTDEVEVEQVVSSTSSLPVRDSSHHPPTREQSSSSHVRLSPPMSIELSPNMITLVLHRPPPRTPLSCDPRRACAASLDLSSWMSSRLPCCTLVPSHSCLVCLSSGCYLCLATPGDPVSAADPRFPPAGKRMRAPLLPRRPSVLFAPSPVDQVAFVPRPPTPTTDHDRPPARYRRLGHLGQCPAVPLPARSSDLR